MKHGTCQERALLRKAPNLPLERRSRPKVRGLPGQAVTYLRLSEPREESERLPSSLPSERCVSRVSRPASRLPAARADWPVAHYFPQRAGTLAASSVCRALRLLRRLRNRGTRGFRRGRRLARS
jgi:hypothetical protein